jgi:HAD superfamily hydrolase (TIGR01490 family)
MALPPHLALFDLDGTLTPLDTQLLFRHFVIKKEPWRCLLLLPFLLALPLALLKILDTKAMKRLFLAYLWRTPSAKLREWADEFATLVAAHLIFPETKNLLDAHREQGALCLLNTASPDLYAIPLATKLGFDHVIATPLSLPSRMPLFPVIDGPNNKGREKIPPMTALLGPEVWDTRYRRNISSYSDSHADQPLLELATHRFLVEPTSRLKALSLNWKNDPQVVVTVIRPRLPWSNGWGKAWLMLRLLLGWGPMPTLPES